MKLAKQIPPPTTAPARKKNPRKLICVSCSPAVHEQILAGAQNAGLKPGPFLIECALKSNATLLRGRDLFLEKKLRDMLEAAILPKLSNH
jgi:hypothetical protein